MANPTVQKWFIFIDFCDLKILICVSMDNIYNAVSMVPSVLAGMLKIEISKSLRQHFKSGNSALAVGAAPAGPALRI